MKRTLCVIWFMMAGVFGSAQAATKMYFIHSDHLGTPQVLTDQEQTVVWRAEQQPFGGAVVDEDPDGDGVNVTLPLRFPGQYHDRETGLNYNYFRDYDPAIGRYVQSDPIGLRGGLNTYGYVLQNPLRYFDFFGLEKLVLFDPNDTIVYNSSQAVPDQDGVLNVWGHASQDNIKDDRGGISNREELNASELAELIKKSGLWDPGMPVVIWGCNSGKGNNSIAQQLSDELGTWVKAPDGYLIVVGSSYRVRKGTTLGSGSSSFKNFAHGSGFDTSTDGVCECPNF